jgi:anti-sigma regulatory factor (Ser/Thr protein kinase)
VSGFNHYALVYRSEAEFADHVVPFIRAGVADDAAIMVATDRAKLALLEERLGPDSAHVRFEDMRKLGRNPGAIISAWQEFAQANEGRPLRGLGEPAWPGRSPAELTECRQHECLLNAAFADAHDFQLVCPYDGRGLDAAVLERVSDSHLHVVAGDGDHASHTYVEPADLQQLLEEPLPAPPAYAITETFDITTLRRIRHMTRDFVHAAGINGDTAADFVFSVNELCENSVRHGSGGGLLRAWREGGHLIVEIADQGRLTDPLAGRRWPQQAAGGGKGLWLAHQVCHLVQVRSTDSGTRVRAHLRLPLLATA